MPITEEGRKRLSESRKGKPLSAETRAKMSAAKKGKKLPAEVCAKISKSHIGITHSDATKKAISEAKIKYAAMREKMTGFKYNIDDSPAFTADSRQFQKPYWIDDKSWTEQKTNAFLWKLLAISWTTRNLWDREKDWINSLFKNIEIVDKF